MEISVEKNVWLRRISTGEKVMITDIVDYEGKSEFVFMWKLGFGMNETKDRETVPYHNMKHFMADFMPWAIIEESNSTSAPSAVSVAENKTPTVLEKNQDNFDEMRKILFETMRDLKDGKIKGEVAREIHNTAQTIINTVKVELEYEKVAKVGAKSKMVG